MSLYGDFVDFKCLAKEIADSVEYVSNSVNLWRELEDRYDQTNGAKHYQIQKETNDVSQGVPDITGYYTKMKKLWEELTNLSAKSLYSCQCTCGAKENMHKAEQDRRSDTIFMGLNESTQGTQNYNSNTHNHNQHPRNNKRKRYCSNVVTGAQGMPSDMMTTKGEDLEHQGSHRNQNVNLSKEQYEQVVRLLQHFQSDGAGENSNSTNIVNGAVNLQYVTNSSGGSSVFPNFMSPSHTMHSPPTSNDTSSSSPHTSYPHVPKINQRVSNTVSKVPSYLSNNICSMPNLKPSHNAKTNQKNSSFSLNALISQSNHITSDVLNPDSQRVVRSICHDREPFSYEEAASNPAWK
ncbi:PREDICTED: uncharacterized protein LOC109238329 [Nicotiana attenuata]|uniref:uncharacterized protein LOC109238329 n=1 Tax=Nicotiana attenuata TaxID=49451 RepID=UPI0009051954|nr:PREDICTED: uncharacterized protein LOC109238329 [Nicotiana attenuata]